MAEKKKENANTTAKTKTSKTKKELNTKKIIDPKTGKAKVVTKKEEKTKIPSVTKTPKKTETNSKKAEVVVEEKETPKVKKTALPKKSSKELTIEPVRKEPAPLVRPQPKKTKELTKEEKALYKELNESFTYIVNLAQVIEDRTMDRKTIPDLAIGELHVIETVNKYNNKPMTFIANKEHVTVGALTTCVNRLVQKGYLLRIRDEMDQRIILLSVTPKAKKVLKSHDKFHEDILGLALEGVSLAQATKVMSQFAHTLAVYDNPLLLEEEKKKNTKKK